MRQPRYLKMCRGFLEIHQSEWVEIGQLHAYEGIHIEEQLFTDVVQEPRTARAEGIPELCFNPLAYLESYGVHCGFGAAEMRLHERYQAAGDVLNVDDVFVVDHDYFPMQNASKMELRTSLEAISPVMPDSVLQAVSNRTLKRS